MSLTFRLLNDEQRKAIAEATFELLQSVGVRLTEPEAQELLHGAGAHIERGRAFLPASLIEEAIRSAPAEILIYTQ